MLRPLLPLLLVPALVLGLPPLFASGPAPGPGQVLEMHRELFAELDRGGPEGAAQVARHMREVKGGLCWSEEKGWGDPGRFLALALAPGDEALRSTDPRRAAASLSHWADGGWKTTIQSAWSDCGSPERSYCVLELERTRKVNGVLERKRYRSTSLVSYRDGRWVLWHFHLSPA